MSASYKLDRNCLGGGLMLSVTKDITFNLFAIEEKAIKIFYIELNLRNNKWLVNSSYNPYKSSIGTHLDRLSKSLDLFFSGYEKIIFLGDFNITDDENNTKSFCENIKNLIRKPTWYKYSYNSAYIVLILKNAPHNFQITCVVETKMPDFHIMTLTIMRESSKKYQSKY